MTTNSHMQLFGLACIGSERTQKARIGVGENLEINGLWHKCDKHENGSVVYTQENSCFDVNGKEIKIGDSFKLANLIFACDDGKFKVIG